MPNYGVAQAGGSLAALSPGDIFTLFNAETPTPPQASVAFALASAPAGAPPILTFQVVAAGTFSCQVQGSNLDIAADYVNLGTAITASPGSYTDTNAFAFYRINVTALSTGPITVIVRRA